MANISRYKSYTLRETGVMTIGKICKAGLPKNRRRDLYHWLQNPSTIFRLHHGYK